MKLKGDPTKRQLGWDDAIALPVGTHVRDYEGETGTVVELEWQGQPFKRVDWDDGCITMLHRPKSRKSKTGIFPR